MIPVANIFNEQKIMQQIEELNKLLQIQEKRITLILTELDEIKKKLDELKK